MSKKIFEVGFIGGAINSAVGLVHKIASQMDDRFRLVAGCFSRDAEINKTTGLQWNIDANRIYNNWNHMIETERDQLDAIIILTPTNEHYSPIERCLNSNIPVISEKSLTKSVKEARELKKIVEEKKVFLTVTYNYTGYAAVRELKARIKRGDFGKINQILIEMPQEGFIKVSHDSKPIIPQQWRLHDYEIPTISLDLGIHIHNLISFLTQEDFVKVYAVENSFGFFKEIVDDIHAIAQFSNNVICNIWYSKSALGNRNGLRIRLFGKEGSAEWVQMNPEELTIYDNRGQEYVINRGNNLALIMNQPRYNRFKAGHPGGFIEAFANLYEDIYEALDNYKKSNIDYHTEYTFSIDDAIRGLAFLDALHKSNLEQN